MFSPLWPYVGGLAGLGVMLVLLTTWIANEGPTAALGPFEVLGLVSMGSALGIAATASRSIGAMQDASEGDAQAIHATQIRRTTLLQIPWLAASAIAIALVMAH